MPLAARAMAVATILWLAAWQVDARVQPVSRRTCNASYIVWSLALNYSMLLAFACVAAQDAMLLAGELHIVAGHICHASIYVQSEIFEGSSVTSTGMTALQGCRCIVLVAVCCSR